MDFLIPANSKKSMLLFGVFEWFDLIIFGIGLIVSMALLFFVSPTSLLGAMIDVAPALITGFLVMPIPNYHNMRTLIVEVYNFYTRREKFIWKGWCVNGEYGETKQIHK